MNADVVFTQQYGIPYLSSNKVCQEYLRHSLLNHLRQTTPCVNTYEYIMIPHYSFGCLIIVDPVVSSSV